MDKMRDSRRANDKFFSDQKARAEAINEKVRLRYDEIKQREAVATEKRAKVTRYNADVSADEFEAIGGKLSKIETSLDTSIERNRTSIGMKTIQPKARNEFIAGNVERFRETETQWLESRHVDHHKKHGELRRKVDAKRREAAKLVEELKMDDEKTNANIEHRIRSERYKMDMRNRELQTKF